MEHSPSKLRRSSFWSQLDGLASTHPPRRYSTTNFTSVCTCLGPFRPLASIQRSDGEIEDRPILRCTQTARLSSHHQLDQSRRTHTHSDSPPLTSQRYLEAGTAKDANGPSCVVRGAASTSESSTCMGADTLRHGITTISHPFLQADVTPSMHRIRGA